MTFYDLLGVSQTASADEVRLGFKRKALTTHPDKLGPAASEVDKKAAEIRFRNLHEAFETLSDPVQRNAYDLRINAAARYLKTRQQAPSSPSSADRMKSSVDQLNSALADLQASAAQLNDLVGNLLGSLRNQNPEWEARRQELLKQQAERAKAAQGL